MSIYYSLIDLWLMALRANFMAVGDICGVSMQTVAVRVCREVPRAAEGASHGVGNDLGQRTPCRATTKPVVGLLSGS